MNFFDDPILNSPYLLPQKHWELDEDNRPTNQVTETRRSSELLTALPGASATSDRAHTRSLFENVGLSTEATEFNPSRIINELRQELDTWRRLPNPTQWKVTPTTQRLLQHWRALQVDDTRSIRPFFCQVEAVEAAIWLSEGAPEMGKRGKRFLRWLNTANNFAVQPEGAEPSAAAPDILRVAFKLATGAGKGLHRRLLLDRRKGA